MTLNGVIDLILHYFTEFHVSGPITVVEDMPIMSANLCVRFLVPCKWNFLFPSVTCIVYSVVAFNVSLTLLCDDAKFK